ncbi:unnamed protein product [Parascedosporium putredinis]|uniref:Proteasome subunit alpha type n=1 Tax=Parascedosporium putredinis TaxID=1442378 RepID=A0A9P1H7S4_9PEZI|nr:unnamed protein product [Parascedosporium putredinis]CAI7998721.1 unnamed protein product [Parascedosporium putredinis]
MFRNNYDNDTVTFSPQGRIFQIEYASESVKQGSVVVGLTSKTHAVLVAIKRNAEELSSYQKKLFAIDEHVGIGIAGLTSDARVLSNFMKNQCLSHRFTMARALRISDLVDMIGEKEQYNTQHYGRRPYGVGLLIAGVDSQGPHLFTTQPSGLTEEVVAFAIGARSQMARTYLEKHIDEFADCDREALITHGLNALKESLAQDKELTVDNTSVAYVGVGSNGKVTDVFKVYDGQDVKDWIEAANTERAEGMDVDG